MFINFSPTNKTVHNYLSRSALWTKTYSRYKKQRIALIKLWELCIFPVELFHISVIFYCRGIFRRPNLISNNDIRIIILMRSQLIIFSNSGLHEMQTRLCNSTKRFLHLTEWLKNWARKHSSRMPTAHIQPHTLHNEQVWKCSGGPCTVRFKLNKFEYVGGGLGLGPGGSLYGGGWG